jgi:hypothetical protein
MVFHELFAGVTSSLLISPIMSILDISIIKSQLQKEKLSKSLTDNVSYYANNKRSFLKPFQTMNLVYSATYCTANVTELLCKKMNIDYRLPTLMATSTANILTIMYKDIQYSKLLKKKDVRFPLTSNMLFAVRDMSTIMTCFIWKKDVINYMDKYMMHNKSEIIASVLMPCLVQITSTPLHILAIDMYENPNQKFSERLKNIPTVYRSVLMGRMMRAFPAFGLGGFINDMLRPEREF